MPDRAARSAPARRLLGVDIGGTFTDFVYWDGAAVRIAKRPSTPQQPAQAVLDGIRALGWDPDEVIHGSTVATNTLLTRRGARTALITTHGFRDTLVIGRQARPLLYALHPTRPGPLAPDRLRFEVRERVAADGSVLRPLEDADVTAVLDRARKRGATALAICLLFSFRNPAHEARIEAMAKAAGFEVSVSHRVLPEPREYERMSTTVANAYVAPAMRRYLTELEEGLRRRRPVRLRVMQSNGGSLSAGRAGHEAVRTVLSGPAGGVAGAFRAAQDAGFSHVITLDMGGTSTDVSLCPGRMLERTDLTLEGIPIKTPALDIHTVGAGGGSIAWLDSGGALRVGPQSAGADPGPAAYGRGTAPTVTDAHVVLGRLRPDRFLGGAMQLDVARADEAVGTLVHAFGGNIRRAAQAIVDVANANMARALRVISVERGFDPEAFALLAFGGAGPLHACDLADEVGIYTVVIPPSPGVLSAMGMLQADVTKDEAEAVLIPVVADARGPVPALERAFRRLQHRARTALAADGYRRAVRIERSADLRYTGQSHELPVPLGANVSAAGIRRALAGAHEERFGHADTERAVEVVVARVKARAAGFRTPADASAAPSGTGVKPEDTAPAAQSEQVVWNRARRTAIIDRAHVQRRGLRGPAILTQMDSTILVPPGWQAHVHPSGALILRRQA